MKRLSKDVQVRVLLAYSVCYGGMVDATDGKMIQLNNNAQLAQR